MPIGLIPVLGAGLALKVVRANLPSDSRTSKHNPEEFARLKAEYQGSLGLNDKATFAADAFDNHAQGRTADLRGLATAKTPGGTVVSQKLAEIANNAADPNNAGAKAVTAAIGVALTTTQAFNTAKDVYSAQVKQFDTLKKGIPKEFTVQELVGLMTELKNNARQAIVAQQTHEKQLLTDQLNTPALAKQLEQSLSLKNQAEVDAVKANLGADLAETHKKQLGEFDKATEESLKKLNDAAAAEINQLLFIANLYKNTGDAVMRQTILSLSAANAAKKQQAGIANGEVVVQDNAGQMSLHGVTMNDIKTIHSITGKQIVNQNGVYTIQHDMRWWGLAALYYLDPRNNTQHDADLMAAAVKANGFDRIKVEVNYDNPEVAAQRAKQSYAAAIKAGFAPDKIKVIINGSECKPNDIFKDNPEKLATLNKQSKDIMEQYARITNTMPADPSKPVDLTKIKARLAELRPQPAAANQANQVNNPAPRNPGP